MFTMEKIDIKPYLSAVASKFKSRLAKVQKIGNEQLCETDYFLTEVLFKIAAQGRGFPLEKLENTAIALELLYLATNLGYQALTSSSFSDELLLATDYFYAEAIEQVINLNDPEIVSLLAKAITDTAADRIAADFKLEDGKRLFAAALELGLFLGAFSGAKKNNIRESLNSFPYTNKSELLRIIDG